MARTTTSGTTTREVELLDLVEEPGRLPPVHERVPTSTATVTRVAQWVRHGAGGYRIALERAKRR